jgi:hypothetical protein
LSIDYNKVDGNLQVQNNTAATDISGNTVTHNLQCQGNTPAVTYVALNMVVQGQAQVNAPPVRRDRRASPAFHRPFRVHRATISRIAAEASWAGSARLSDRRDAAGLPIDRLR